MSFLTQFHCPYYVVSSALCIPYSIATCTLHQPEYNSHFFYISIGKYTISPVMVYLLMYFKKYFFTYKIVLYVCTLSKLIKIKIHIFFCPRVMINGDFQKSSGYKTCFENSIYWLNWVVCTMLYNKQNILLE